MLLTDPIESVPGVGPARGKLFRAMGIAAVAHLINHLPFRHEREEAEDDIATIEPGKLIAARGEVTDTRVNNRGKKRFEAVLMDETGRLDLVWFNQPFLFRKITPGDRIRVRGKAGRRGPVLQLINPKWELLPDFVDEINDRGGAGAEPGMYESRLRPVYPGSEELSSLMIEKAVGGVLDGALALIDDHLDESYRRERELPELRAAYRMMHAPAVDDDVQEARRRLVYDELLLLQLGVHLRRSRLRRAHQAPALECDDRLDGRIRGRLPFDLTDGQNTVVKEIAADLAQAEPASRLVQGDVGSGKTAVAVYAMLLAAASGHQAALMAPTELLAEQHYASISRMLEGAKVRTALLTGSLSAPERRQLHEQIEAGEIDLVVGTHAVVSEGVRFKSLAVAIIDEQHRFGVHQRAVLAEKAREQAADGEQSQTPHVIVMTATPIPRTLSLTVFGDLDVSMLKGLPPGRSPVKTYAYAPQQRNQVYERVLEHVGKGEQAYIVAPAIEEGELGLRAVETLEAELSDGALHSVRIGVVHGRMPAAERDAVMNAFRAHELDALIATTVIEVGVDVPNASVIVIEHAERFGLAQLHQLRGRVGRGSIPGVCMLVADTTTLEAQQRVDALVRTTDGFELAETDLQLRGPGEFFGSKQSGLSPFRLASFPEDQELLMMARRDAAAWISSSPELDGPGDALIQRRLMKAHGQSLGLITVA